jgi:coenzyme PQQ precursor peptide PqqA
MSGVLVRTYRACHNSYSVGSAPDKANDETEEKMAWKKPRVIEISAAMEINCYVCAKV